MQWNIIYWDYDLLVLEKDIWVVSIWKANIPDGTRLYGWSITNENQEPNVKSNIDEFNKYI